MLFNSYIFLLFFLPVTLAVFFLLGRSGRTELPVAWLVVSSFFFYGWWNAAYLALLIGSILFNYLFGILLSRGSHKIMLQKCLLFFGIAINLSLLAYYKYAHFLVHELNRFLGRDWELGAVLLPLAISFFTFQQIAYLADAFQGKIREAGFLRYCLFVSYFPQLIAGPIVHHKEMLPQFAKKRIYSLSYKQLSVGLTILVLGLFKKVVLADEIAKLSTPVFDAAAQGIQLTFFEAWGGAFAYTLQLYFDFSGYSDMAIGLAALIGIQLPLNFYSPYKAQNIIEFWQRWHITLTRFLREYLYIPLGGNRRGSCRKYGNIMVLMLLGGLWHGAGWTFIIWGGLHGMYIMMNHAWRSLLKRTRGNLVGFSSFVFIYKMLARSLTFMAVVVAWVFFRADNASDAVQIISAMFGGNGLSLFPALLEQSGLSGAFFLEYGIFFQGPFYNGLADWYVGGSLIVVLLALVFWAPNTQQIMGKYGSVLNTYEGNSEVGNDKEGIWQWAPTKKWAIATGFLLACSLIVIGARQNISEFLYFQF
ncbi:MAG: MBOAT family protein [Candidatus Electrothrix sp. GM3_4]|nr:MBOAT family protein [Candidatus Electrothrix sp. GM3_4]